MSNEIIEFVEKLRGRVSDSIIDARINFFTEVQKYKKIFLREIEKTQIALIVELKKDYKKIIEANKNLSIEEIINLTIVPTTYNKKTKQITVDLKKQNFNDFQAEYQENMRKLKIWLATGIFIEKGKEVTWDKSIVYESYIRTKDFDALRRLYKEGKEILISENRLSEVKTDYEWLTTELIYNS